MTVLGDLESYQLASTDAVNVAHNLLLCSLRLLAMSGAMQARSDDDVGEATSLSCTRNAVLYELDIPFSANKQLMHGIVYQQVLTSADSVASIRLSNLLICHQHF